LPRAGQFRKTPPERTCIRGPAATPFAAFARKRVKRREAEIVMASACRQSLQRLTDAQPHRSHAATEPHELAVDPRHFVIPNQCRHRLLVLLVLPEPLRTCEFV